MRDLFGIPVPFLKSFRKSRAIRSYMRRLPALLVNDYGASRSYTAQQVRATIERAGLNTDYACYALAMFTDRDMFAEFHVGIGEHCDYDAMRSEISHAYLHGTADFSVSDIVGLSSADGAHVGGSHDAAAGHDHGGGGHH